MTLRPCLLLTVALAAACGPPPPPEDTPSIPVEPFIEASGAEEAPAGPSIADLQGRWTASGEGWSKRFRFEGSRYIAAGYPTWAESGAVTLLASTGRRMTLRLSDRQFDGRGDEPITLTLVFDGDGEGFWIADEHFQRHGDLLQVAADAPETAHLVDADSPDVTEAQR